MPELSRFNGISIMMYYEDGGQHHKPHVHVNYAEHRASVSLNGDLLEGSLPLKQLHMVEAWAALREDELHKAWVRAVRNENPGKIEPLR
ncbi:MAG: DUF4160 domain-containing protein [Oscillospiraceae bacterium]|nr:DUF4160 domain-containing protein [Oscillospiraceae bacterium]